MTRDNDGRRGTTNVKPYYNDESTGIVLYHGDSREALPALPAGSVDLVLTSPPYNLGNTAIGESAGRRKLGHYSPTAPLGARRGGSAKWSGGELASGYGAHDDAMPFEEYVTWQHATLLECWRILSERGAIYYNHKPRVLDGIEVQPYVYNPGLPVRQTVIWTRAGGVNFSTVFYCPTNEWILILAKPDFRLRDKGASGVGTSWPFAQEAGTPHPAPFPLGLALRAIETTPAETVMDPFAGWGTTLVAAKRLGRRAIGIEIDERWCELAAKRIEAAPLPLFERKAEAVSLF
jgi:site-specific DNA-methyltransferase (adenine-specific)